MLLHGRFVKCPPQNEKAAESSEYVKLYRLPFVTGAIINYVKYPPLQLHYKAPSAHYY